ncbi:MAG: phosphatidate cytidylyltransferase [Actinomycetota bacterium]
MYDRDERDEKAAATPIEGVRILGAEEARTVAGDRGASWSASGEADEAAHVGAEPPSGEVPALQHWAEAPTGAVPAIFTDDTGEQPVVEDDLEAWAGAAGGHRFRGGEADWADVDVAAELAEPVAAAAEDDMDLGAISAPTPVDEEAVFAEEVEARRRGRRRASRPAALTPPVTAPLPVTPSGPGEPGDPGIMPPGATSSRDLPTAIMTAAIVIVLGLVCFQLGRVVTALFAGVILALATAELCATLRTKGMRPATVVALLAAFTFPVAAQQVGEGAYPVYLVLVTATAFGWFLWRVTPGRPVLGVATTLFAFLYVGGLGGFAGLLLSSPDGIGLVLGVVICVVADDVAAFFVGSQMGRERIAPVWSPNKTVAGTAGGMAASVLAGMVLVGMIGPWDWKSGFFLGVLVAFAAFVGDLAESMLKRDLDVKDFGVLLPGHGGVLDRFDALLFCLPVAYFLARGLGYV